MWLPVLIALSGPAHAAGVPVVTDEADTSGLMDTVAGRSGLPLSQLELVPLSRLLNEPAQALGEGVLRRCATGPTTLSTVRTALARAESALRAEDKGTALDQLDLAVAELGCLSELAAPPLAGRIFQLRGALLAEEDEEAGRSELRTALGFGVPLSWQPADPAGGAALLEAVAEETVPYALNVAPPERSSGPWLDAAPVPVSGLDVRKGLHLLQYATPSGIRSGWLVVGGDAVVVLPMAYREPILDKLLEERSRAPVLDLVASTLPNFKGAYVAHAGGLWLVSEEGGQLVLSELIAPPPPVTEEEAAAAAAATTGKGKRRKQGKGKGKVQGSPE